MLPQNLVGVLSIKLVWKLWCAFWDRVEMNERDRTGSARVPERPAPGRTGSVESRLPTRGSSDKVSRQTPPREQAETMVGAAHVLRSAPPR